MVFAALFAQQMGYTHEEFSRMSIYDIAPDASMQIDGLFSKKTGSLLLSTTLRKNSGIRVPYEINMRIVDFVGKSYAVAVARDITERKRAEDALKEAKSRAELYVDLMGHDINNINQSALGYLEMAKDMLVKVGLGSRLKHKPKEMSGGQQQRVGIARAFVANPEIVFADEPTGNLDSKTSKEVMDLIKEMAKTNHQTIVMVTHEDTVACHARRIVRLRDGKVLTDLPREKDPAWHGVKEAMQ
jgi:PAS domain S-box-containing protein